MARQSHIRGCGCAIVFFSSSTWGRADQQTSQDSNRVWGVLFCALLLPLPRTNPALRDKSSRRRSEQCSLDRLESVGVEPALYNQPPAYASLAFRVDAFPIA